MTNDARLDPEPSSPRADTVAGSGGLGMAALGIGNDLPLPYAVLRVSLDETRSRATDACYAYANDEYCQAISREAANVIGRSLFEVDNTDPEAWLESCYRVVTRGETIDDFRYDPIVRSWVSSRLAPSAIEGCCVYLISRVPIDDQQRRKLMATADARTSYFISEMLNDLAAEQGYEASMNGMLARMAAIVQADRICVFECRGLTTKVIFERCKEGQKPQVGVEYGLRQDMMAHWFRNVTKDRVVLVPNVTVLQRFSEPLYQWCLASGVRSLLAAPFFSEGEIVGFLGAYNYQIDETIDLNRLFEAVSTFIAARIDNHRLIERLERASTHDALTELLNRRGAEEAILRLLDQEPKGNFVLALIDLDDFKRVNDVYGHGAGDEALRALAQALKRAFPANAVISRNGGDEFLVMLAGEASLQASTALARLTRQGVTFEHGGQQHHVSLSAGYARYPEQAQTLRELLSKADTALYAVKLAGKAGFGKYTAAAETSRRFQLGFSARDVLDHVPHPLLICAANEAHNILFASERLARDLGFGSVGELLRASKGVFGGIVHPQDRAQIEQLLNRLCAGPDGSHAGISFRAAADGDEGRLLQAECTAVDIEESGRVIYALFNA